MWNENGSVGIVFNGEIYNHRDLRADLIALGHRFASDHSDTEGLVHGYEEWDENLPEGLDGMFAFCLFDQPQRRLFLVRDRLGKKPLYYHHRPGLFAFASELTSLLRHPRVPSDPSPAAIQKLFALGFFPAPHTPYAGVKKLRGGHSLTFDLHIGRAAERS